MGKDVEAMLDDLFDEDAELDELFGEISEKKEEQKREEKKEPEKELSEDDLVAALTRELIEEELSEPKVEDEIVEIPVVEEPMVKPVEEPEVIEEPKVIEEAPIEAVEDIEDSKAVEPIEKVEKVEKKPTKKRPVIKDTVKEPALEKILEATVLENSPTALEKFEGREDFLKRFTVSDPVQASMNIIRTGGGKTELIAMGPTKIIECSDEDAKILIIDHILNRQTLSDRDRRSAYAYEAERPERLKALFGMDDVAKINGLSQEDYEQIMIEVPPAIQSILDKLERELGREIRVTPDIAKAKNETEILKLLLKEGI